MQGIILAAGRGKRLKTLTEESPKCLVQLAGRSLLDWQIAAFERATISPITVVTGYCADRLANDSRFSCIHNAEWEKSNMVISLSKASAILKAEPSIISYSDIVYPASHVETLKSTPGDLVILYDKDWKRLWSARFEDPLSDAETFQVDSSGKLIEIGNRAESLPEIQGQYMGLLKFTPGGWATILKFMESMDGEQRAKLDMTSLLKILLKNKIEIHTAAVQGRWCEVDQESDLALYHEKIREKWSHDWR